MSESVCKKCKGPLTFIGSVMTGKVECKQCLRVAEDAQQFDAMLYGQPKVDLANKEQYRFQDVGRTEQRLLGGNWREDA